MPTILTLLILEPTAKQEYGKQRKRSYSDKHMDLKGRDGWNRKYEYTKIMSCSTIWYQRHHISSSNTGRTAS